MKANIDSYYKLIDFSPINKWIKRLINNKFQKIIYCKIIINITSNFAIWSQLLIYFYHWLTAIFDEFIKKNHIKNHNVQTLQLFQLWPTLQFELRPRGPTGPYVGRVSHRNPESPQAHNGPAYWLLLHDHASS